MQEKKRPPRKFFSRRRKKQGREEQRWRKAEIIIVCDMLLTGFDAPIVQTMYLDKGLKNHTLLQAIARVNRPYNEIKKHGIIRDFWGVFSHLNEALRYDKAELGEVAFPLRRVREEFKLHLETLLDLLKSHERGGSHAAPLPGAAAGAASSGQPSAVRHRRGVASCLSSRRYESGTPAASRAGGSDDLRRLPESGSSACQAKGMVAPASS